MQIMLQKLKNFCSFTKIETRIKNSFNQNMHLINLMNITVFQTFGGKRFFI